MDALDFTANLQDLMTATLEAIIGSLEQIAEAATSASEAMSVAFSEAAVDADALAGSADAAAASTDALAGSMDAATASTDANTVSVKTNADKTKEAAGAHDALAASAKKMVMPLTLAAAVVVGTGVAAVHMAADFQSGLTTLVTGAGESQSNLQMMHDGILQMSAATGESTSQLLQGAFMIESAGHHGADALTVLQAAAEGAKVGAADLGTVADGTTTIMTDFAAQHITAAQAVNSLISTVASGKTHMQDLAASLAQILPTASAAHISLYDVEGAMATMTGEGVPAANAATYLRQTLIALEAPSKQTKDALAAVGLKSSDIAKEMQTSLPDALKTITDAVGKKFPAGSAGYVAALKEISGGSKQMQGMLDLTGTHMKTFQQNTLSISGAAANGGKAIQGWGLVQKDFNQQLSQLSSTAGVAMITLGEALMPLATTLVKDLTPALKSFGEWVSTHGKEASQIFLVLAAVIGGALLAALVIVVGGFIIANAAIIGITIAIGIVIGAIVLLVTHWKQIGDWLSGKWHDILSAVGGWFSNLGTQAHNLWTTLTGAFGKGIAFIGGLFSQLGTTIHNRITQTWANIQAVFHAGVQLVKNIVLGFVHDLVGGFVWLFNHNYYFHDLVIGIQREFLWIKSTIATIWKDVTGFLTGVWNGIVSLGKLAWGVVVKDVQFYWGLAERFIIEPAQRAWNFIYGVGVKIGIALRLAWGVVSHDAQSAWNGFVGLITGVGGRVGGAVQDNVISPITRVIGTLVSGAEQWGKNLITNFINGIKNMAGAVGSAAGGIASTIGKFLGFHSPAEAGPGATADEWMPNLVSMLAAGLTQHAPLLGRAAQTAAGQIAGALGSPSGTLGAGGAFPASALATGAAGNGGGPTQITVVLQDQTGMGGLVAGMRMLDPRVRQLLAQEIAREMQQQGLLQGRQPIGFTGSK